MQSVQAVFVYTTLPDEQEAARMAAVIVADRLAACANVLPGMTSVYHWQGKIETAQEVVIIFKTRAALAPAIEARIKELHSYETPAIVVLPVQGGSAEYLAWIGAETKP